MKCPLFVVLFLSTESVVPRLIDLRTSSAIKVYDIPEFVEKLTDFSDFNGMLTTVIRANAHRRYREIAGHEIYDVRNDLRLLNNIFMAVCKFYVEEYLLIEYFKLAVRTLKEKDEHAEKDVRTSIGFPGDYKYCMLTAFYDVDFNVHSLFEITFFLQTFDQDDNYTFDNLDAQLKRYQRIYDHFPELSEKEPRMQKPIVSFKILTMRLNDIKRKISNFSNAFCPGWTPFINHLLITEIASDNIRNETPFIRYVIQNEKCVINYEVQHEESQQSRIDTWDCDGILESQEYRFQRYNEDVSENFGIKKKVITMFMKLCSLRSFSPTKAVYKCECSLATLRDELKSKSYFLDFMKYSNIASEVTLLVSIKEGRKIFKGLKHTVVKRCKNETTENAVDEIRGLRSTLSAFKSVFDKLVVLIQDKKRINLKYNDVLYLQKHEFNQLVNSLMRLLDIQRDEYVEQMHRICSEIPETLLNGENYDAHLGDRPITVKFEEFYLTEPILNITQLYRFYENNL